MSITSDLPRLSPLGDGRFCVQGTAVAIGPAAVLLLGSSGSGKSGTAAQLILHGAQMISDDLVILAPRDDGVICSRPDGGPEAMELRGFGILSMPSASHVRLGLAIHLDASGPRLPDGEAWSTPMGDVPLIRHPASPDLAAKITLWMRKQ